jgi:hypothetical protein
MSSPFRSGLAKLDISLQSLAAQIECLRAGLEIDEGLLGRTLADVEQHGLLLRELIASERPDAGWQDRQDLERLLGELEIAARERQTQQQRDRLLQIADELAAGTVTHRLEARSASLNALRLKAIEELRQEAARPEAPKELPGPSAGEWLSWAFSLQEDEGPEDTAVAEELRRDFPALDRFAGELEERYWHPAERTAKAPVTIPQPPRSTAVPSHSSSSDSLPRPNLSQTISAPMLAPPDPKPPVTRPDSSPTSKTSAVTAAIPLSQTPARANEVTGDDHRASGKAASDKKVAAASEARVASPPELLSAPPHKATSAPMPEPPQLSTSEFAKAEPTEVSNADPSQVLSNESLPTFGVLLPSKRPLTVWLGAAGVIVLCAVFAGIHHFSVAAGSIPHGTTTSGSAAGKSGDVLPDASGPNGQVETADLKTGAPGQPLSDLAHNGGKANFPLLNKMPGEGVQRDILLNLELCERANPDIVECWGYVSNNGAESSHVSLSSADVVDGKGNSFNLTGNGRFDFQNGRTSTLAPKSRTKYVVRVPDKDRDARTLTLYLDINNPHSLEYTFRDIPIAQ